MLVVLRIGLLVAACFHLVAMAQSTDVYSPRFSSAVLLL